eukprot:TRINITY_DN6456_c0_g2_i8.p1 TRINITY_DN6456_c0_g2~~TRINITY_DN6456_c0_g2_i8.p1  ORF type:complete len:108 (-),score=21.26 TRINITY_DN6456_c0_g2_i8:46-369(-)
MNGYTSETPQVKWFWDWVELLSDSHKAMLLQFVTGSCCVPFGGFANLQGLEGPSPFTLHRSTENQHQLPTATTCYNILKLPEYDSPEVLSQKCLVAIMNGHFGFSFN